MIQALAIPSFYDRNRAGKEFYPNYGAIAKEANRIRKQFNIIPTNKGEDRINLIIVDPQDTFCRIIDGAAELYVANGELHMANTAEFIYRYAHVIDNIDVTIDTHSFWQIDLPGFWIYPDGSLVTDNVQITYQDLRDGKYLVNPQMEALNDYGLTYAQLQSYALHYVQTVKAERGEDHAKWAGHAMAFGPGWTVIPILYEALMYWAILRGSQINWRVKGDRQLSQRYSPVREQILQIGNLQVGVIDTNVINEWTKRNGTGKLVNFVAGEADSHCVNWMIRDTFEQMEQVSPGIGQTIVPLADCTGPVIIPNVVDFTFAEDALFQFCADNGIIVREAANAAQWINQVVN